MQFEELENVKLQEILLNNDPAITVPWPFFLFNFITFNYIKCITFSSATWKDRAYMYFDKWKLIHIDFPTFFIVQYRSGVRNQLDSPIHVDTN